MIDTGDTTPAAVEWSEAEREAVREVLQAHLWHHTATTHCSCGWREPLAQLSVVRWTEHVADEVAEAQAPFIAERERQAAARALRMAAQAVRDRADVAEMADGGKLETWDALVGVEDQISERIEAIERGEQP